MYFNPNGTEVTASDLVLTQAYTPETGGQMISQFQIWPNWGGAAVTPMYVDKLQVFSGCGQMTPYRQEDHRQQRMAS